MVEAREIVESEAAFVKGQMAPLSVKPFVGYNNYYFGFYLYYYYHWYFFFFYC